MQFVNFSFLFCSSDSTNCFPPPAHYDILQFLLQIQLIHLRRLHSLMACSTKFYSRQSFHFFRTSYNAQSFTEKELPENSHTNSNNALVSTCLLVLEIARLKVACLSLKQKPSVDRKCWREKLPNLKIAIRTPFREMSKTTSYNEKSVLEKIENFNFCCYQKQKMINN